MGGGLYQEFSPLPWRHDVTESVQSPDGLGVSSQPTQMLNLLTIMSEHRAESASW